MDSNENNKADISDTNDTYNTHRTDTSSAEMTDNTTNQGKSTKKKIMIEVDEDDPCLKKEEEKQFKGDAFFVPGNDPRFQQQNQTLRCWVMYTDFYRCEHILGAGSNACTWFKQVFTSICPKNWILDWDDLRLANKLPWHKYKTQGKFPGDKYGV